MPKFGYDDEDDDVLAPKEPQVNAPEPEERKAARALRIKRRKDAIKKAEQPAEEATGEEEPGLIEQTTSTAAEQLQRLEFDGSAMVTNVKVTTDEREVIRRNLLADSMRESMHKMEDAAELAQTQYETITANWDAMMELKDPLDIDATMKEQKQRCDELLQGKNDLINYLKSELKKMDEAYYEDLNKQDKDIKELSERIEKQVTIMQRAYEKQLFLIEAAINIEREALVDHNNKRWESLYKLRDKEELQHIDYKYEQQEDFKEVIDRIMWDHHEKYRLAKIELETLIQDLQKELEKLKATCLINTEKIGYNYQILKKREEENVFVRSQQKRKLNKMSDIANALRSKIRKAAEDGAVEEVKADAEIVKLMQAMDEIEKKSNHFAQVNNYKFEQVWRMCISRCYDLMHELRHAEVAIHAHVLAEPPPPPLPKPPKSPLMPKSEDNAVQVETQVVDDKYRQSKEKLVKHILQLVSDNTGFLIEDRLLTLISKYQPSSQNLCTLDAIFMALEIQSEEDIELLSQTFLNYAFCPICVGMEDAMTSELEGADSSQPDVNQQARGRGTGTSMRARATNARSLSCSTSRSVGFRGQDLSPEDQLLITEADEILQVVGDPQAPPPLVGTSSEAGTTVSRGRPGGRGVTVSATPAEDELIPNPYLCPVGHLLEIEAMQVLTALGDFISVFIPPEKKRLYTILNSVKPPNFETPTRNLKSEDIEKYWSAWKTAFPAEKDRFWDGLLTGLNDYLQILQEREKLHEEVMVLRQRNRGLRQLVRGILPKIQHTVPGYIRPQPASFTSTIIDHHAGPELRLPPISHQ